MPPELHATINYLNSQFAARSDPHLAHPTTRALQKSIHPIKMFDHEMPGEILFVSMATAVLDKITVAGQLVAQNSTGGSAVFSSLGARLFNPPTPLQKSPVALRIHAGHDFPVDALHLLNSWQMVLDVRRDPHQPSTRAEVTYHDASLEKRDFRYVTPVRSMKPTDLELGDQMLAAKIFHFFTAPEALHEQLSQVAALRQIAGMNMPITIWEPRSRTYIPDKLQHAFESAKLADIISPNHIELLELFAQPTSGQFDPAQIESFAQVLAASGIGRDNNGIIVSLQTQSSTCRYEMRNRFPSLCHHIRQWTMTHLKFV
jgi:hypothetical protein